MLATLILRYYKKLIHLKNERLTEILQTVRWHILWLYYYLDNKMSIFEEYGTFNISKWNS